MFSFTHPNKNKIIYKKGNYFKLSYANKDIITITPSNALNVACTISIQLI